jgi:hypothetical protein
MQNTYYFYRRFDPLPSSIPGEFLRFLKNNNEQHNRRTSKENSPTASIIHFPSRRTTTTAVLLSPPIIQSIHRRRIPIPVLVLILVPRARRHSGRKRRRRTHRYRRSYSSPDDTEKDPVIFFNPSPQRVCKIVVRTAVTTIHAPSPSPSLETPTSAQGDGCTPTTIRGRYSCPARSRC